MSFLVDRSTRVLIQGITGQLGSVVIDLMARSGFAPVAGVSPGRGGRQVKGVPVFDTVAEAVDRTQANASLVLVPAGRLRDASDEAIDAGIDTIVLMVDGVPIATSLAITRAARAAGVTLLGPNTAGVITPGEAMVGALNPEQFPPGDFALISRSGGMMSTIAHTLGRVGLGLSTAVGIGGDTIIGLDMPQAVRLADDDPATAGIVIFGEIGGAQEQRVAELVATGVVTKPVIAYIAGVAAPTGIRYSHAGAQADGDGGTAAAKRASMARAGIRVVDRYVDIPDALGAPA